MKRFFYIPFFLLLALLLASLANAYAADRCVAQWCGTLSDVQSAAQSGDWENVRAQLDALHESWDERAVYFHIILQHDELNEAEALLARAQSFSAGQDETEFHACLAELISQLRVLSEMQEISIKNIL